MVFFCVMMGRSLCIKQKKNLLFYEIYHRAPILNRDDITAYQCYTGQCSYYIAHPYYTGILFQWYGPLKFSMDACVCALKMLSKKRDTPRLNILILMHLIDVTVFEIMRIYSVDSSSRSSLLSFLSFSSFLLLSEITIFSLISLFFAFFSSCLHSKI